MKKLSEYKYIIPIGDHCTPSILLKELNLRKYSYPFDWFQQSELDNMIGNLNYYFENISDLFFIEDENEFIEKYIGNMFEHPKKINTNNKILFAHEYGTKDIIIEKYKRRFNRLKEHYKEGNCLFILITRKTINNIENFKIFVKKMKEYNNDFLCITGEYDNNLNQCNNINYAHIKYIFGKDFSYDTIFRSQILHYLKNNI